jgi:hypothetical protein
MLLNGMDEQKVMDITGLTASDLALLSH